MKTFLTLTIVCLLAVSALADSTKPIYVVRFDDYHEGSEMEGSVLTVFSLSKTAPVESVALGGLWSVWHEAHIHLSRFQQDV